MLTIQLDCLQCSKLYRVSLSRQNTSKYCSRSCRSRATPRNGSKHPRWKGGRVINSQGYVLVYAPEHPLKNANNKIREHRLVMEKFIGRQLHSYEDVHHINGNKQDNDIENLQLLGKRAHARLHGRKMVKKGIYKNCVFCDKRFYVCQSLKRVECCSISCKTKLTWSTKGKEGFGR